jgi:O-antigen/teichoic acid export membrane protein
MKDFVPLFFGSKFLKVKDLVAYITPIILFVSWSNLFGIQVMVPMKKEKYLTFSVIAGAIVNFFMNLILIPRYQSLGAVIGTVAAEFSVTLVQMILVRKLITLKPLFSQTWKHIVAGITTLFVLLLLSQINVNPSGKIILETATGLIVYVSVEMVLKSSINAFVFRKIFSFLKIYPS